MIDESLALDRSLLHSLDPRARLVTAGLFSAAVALAQDPSRVAGCLGLALALLLAARPSPRKVLTGLVGANLFILFLWVVLPFTSPGEKAFSLGPLTATHRGLQLALLVTLKSNAIIAAVMALVSTIPVPLAGGALRSLGVPAKLTCLLVYTYRYLFELARQYRRLRETMQVRGFSPANNMHTYRSFANLAAVLLLTGYDKAQRVGEAMVCRGFDGRFRHLTRLRFGPRDAIFSVACLAATFLILWMPA